MSVQRSRASIRPALLIPVSIPLALAFTYAASPYVALWQLGRAMQSHDMRELGSAIDWKGVRSGLKQEIELGLAGPAPVVREASAMVRTGIVSPALVKPAMARPTLDAASDDLPDFGDSFATTEIGASVDTECTPEHLAGLLASVAAPGRDGGAIASARRMLKWAFFTSPRRFVALLNVGAPGSAPVRVSMAFTRKAGWRVTRVWLPPSLLEQGGQERT